ncbi:GFA family protein [Halomonas elongata]|uniref:GFA family protein n=1 Tax=Halomonas elongata TaxID=2746 RepID=UPI00255A8C2D|nr:GFA family protein [Halomonas elongata]MDL4862570.1 GFA family protein [Halomonas elongata]
MAINLSEVGGVRIGAKHRATCHCGSVEVELDLPDGLVDVRRCDCSLCRRRGAIVASVPGAGIRIVKGESALKLYQFNTKTARHYFCSNCGIYTHHQRRSNPSLYGFNVACLEGINPLKIDGVPVYDGVNHPADTKNT